MSTDPTNYDPEYISIAALPVDDERSYSADRKRKALYNAEPKLEADVNGGDPIEAEELTQLHKVAVATLATYELARSAVSPSNATLGDLTDDGGNRESYAESFLTDYNELVDQINNTSGNDEQDAVFYGSTSATTDSVAVNGRDGDQMEHRYPYRRDARWPDE